MSVEIWLIFLRLHPDCDPAGFIETVARGTHEIIQQYEEVENAEKEKWANRQVVLKVIP